MKRIALYFLCLSAMLFQTVAAQNLNYAIVRIMAPSQSKTGDAREFFIEINDEYVGNVQAHQYVSLKLMPGTYNLNLYSNTTPAGVAISNCSYEVAKKYGYSISYSDVRLSAGNVYFLDVTNVKGLSGQPAFDKALTQKKIVAGDTYDLTKRQVIPTQEKSKSMEGRSVVPEKQENNITINNTASKKKTNKQEIQEPTYNPVWNKQLPLKIDTSDFQFEARLAPNFCKEYIYKDLSMNYIDGVSSVLGTIYIHCLHYTDYGIDIIVAIDILDNNNHLISTYIYQDQRPSSKKNKLLYASQNIMDKFRQDYIRDYDKIHAALQAPPVQTKKATLVICSPAGVEEPDYKTFIEIDGKRVGFVSYKGMKEFELMTGRHKIVLYGNKYITYHGFLGLIDKQNYTGNPDYAEQVCENYSRIVYLSEGTTYVNTLTNSMNKDQVEGYLNTDMLRNPTINTIPTLASESIKPSPVQQKTSALQSDVDKNIAQAASQSPNTYVLIFANEKYEFLDNVNYASNDGKIFKEYCVKTLGVPERQIFYYENATAGKIEDGISKLTYCLNNFSGAKAIIYYCGHGIPDEKTNAAYLIPTDGKGTNSRTCYSLNELYKTLAATNAQSITYFMDACFTGANKDGSMLVAARGIARAPQKETLAGKTIVFSASSGDETAMTLDEQGHGLFTYYLLKKLQETKGDVTYGELADYIHQNVKKDAFLINEKPQTPVVATSPAIVDTWKTMKLK